MEQKKLSRGLIIGVAVIIVLIIGGIYYWNRSAKGLSENKNTSAATQTAAVVSASDDLNAIESDLNSEDLKTLDTDLKNL